MEVTRIVANYGQKSSSFSKGSVCEEDFDYDSEVLRVVQDEDEDQNASTQNMEGEKKAKVLHGRTKGLSSCFEGIVHIFKHIFPCQDAHGDDDKEPLLEDPSPQGQGEVENGSTQVQYFEDGSTAEAERGGGTQSVTAAAFRRPRDPKSPGLNPGSGAQHN